MYDELLGTYYEKDGRIYRCIGLITSPAVILEDIETKNQETHVIDCLNYKEFKHLIQDK
jgi:hypothetical protein